MVPIVYGIRHQSNNCNVHRLQDWCGPKVSEITHIYPRDLCHVQLHPTWFEPTSECMSWPVALNMYSGHFSVGLYLGRGSLLLVGPLFHFRQCHSGLVSSRNEHIGGYVIFTYAIWGRHHRMGLYLGRGSLLLVGPLFHFRQCHSGSVSSRNEHIGGYVIFT